MKCISLWQPWATLMANGSKKNETRSWSTSYRGRIAIHAAKKWNKELRDLCWTEPFKTALWFDLGKPLPRGALLCTVTIVDCIEITETNAPSSPEHDCGDYTPGRFMWITEDLQRATSPVACRGAQGIFEVPDSLVRGTSS